jgi:hypothetical protein
VCGSLSANDTLATLGAGGLVPTKSTEIALESEDLDISLRQVRVRYSFRNTSDHDIDAVVAFPLPDIDGGDLFHVPTAIPFSDPVNFVDFKVEQLWPAPGSGHASWNRKAIAIDTEVRAFHDGKDITQKLTQLKLPVSVADPRLDSAIDALSREVREALLKEELIGWEGTAGVDKRELYWAGWITRVQFYWKQRFAAKATTVLEQTYVPIVGGGYIVKNEDRTTPGETADLRPFCVRPGQRKSIAELLSRTPAPDGEVALLEREIDYILTTANNWSGPIREFRLSIHTDTPDDILVTCMPGIIQSSPTEYRLTRSNFRPDSELKVMIIQMPPPPPAATSQ